MRNLRTECNTMETEALKNAKNKYRREKVTRIPLDIYPTEKDILDHLYTVKNRQGYIKDLIRADMKKEKDTH